MTGYWNQTYYLFGQGLGISALIAALPIFTLLLLLGVLRKPSWLASPIGYAVALLIAVFGYGMPLGKALSSSAYGAAFGLFPILWIVFWALVLFRITVETGKFEVIKNSIGHLTDDPRLQALLIAVAFGGFLEGAAGFGAPVAIAAAMMIGLGFSAYNASMVCLLANTSPVAFGSIGIPVITLAGITALPLARLSTDVGRICAPITCILPIYIVLAMGGIEAASGIWLPLITAGAVFGGMQWFVSGHFGPQLTDILASLCTLLVLVVMLRMRRNHATQQNAAVEMKFRGQALLGGSLKGAVAPTLRQILAAWTPFALLVLCVLLWGWPKLQPLLNVPTHALPWPALHDLVMRMPPIVSAPVPYHAIYNVNWLSASGTACMVATLLAAAFLRMKPSAFAKCFLAVVKQLALPTVTVCSVLALAFLMNYCGATATLGLAFAATGAMFPFFSALLGWVGVFLTGSDTSANALFGNLQVVTAGRLGFSAVLMAAANSAGGVMGKMISLQSIAVAAAATGMRNEGQSKLFRSVLKHSILLSALTGAVVMLYAYVLHLR